MAGKGRFVFSFKDIYGDPLNDRVNVTVKHMVLNQGANIPSHDARKRLTISDLDSTQTGRYLVQVFPHHCRPVTLFLRCIADAKVEHEFVLPFNPKEARAAFPPFSKLGSDLKKLLENSKVEGMENKKGEALYQALDDLQKAGLLNLYAKMKATRFQSERDVFSYMTSLKRVRGERFFADVEKDLRDRVKDSVPTDLFEKVPGALHQPPQGFSLSDSFKTDDDSGNLQLTFFLKTDAIEFRVDADIDRSRGLEHVFDVISHSISGKDTHPYDVHALLLMDQKIDTGYRLSVEPA